MNHRLKPLHLLPPPASTPWTGVPINPEKGQIDRRVGESLPLDLPLFWYDPHWYHVTTDQADNLAIAVGSLDVVIAAMASDLSGPSSRSMFHSEAKEMLTRTDADSDELHQDAGVGGGNPFPRIVPYRPERYGLSVADFDDAFLVDVRLWMPRDVSGRFAFSPAQIQRWEASPSSEPIAGGGWVPAATFPPDVVSMDHLSSKLAQLRRLSPSAALFVSMGPYRMIDELPKLLAAQPDGLILRLDETLLDGLELAALTHRARQMMIAEKQPQLPLWVVPGEVTPDDAVKLIALGASAVAIDAWCNPLVEETQQSQSESGVEKPIDESEHQYDPRWGDFASDHIGDSIERFRGLHESLANVSAKEQLGSFSATWAKTLGVRALK